MCFQPESAMIKRDTVLKGTALKALYLKCIIPSLTQCIFGDWEVNSSSHVYEDIENSDPAAATF